MYGNAMETSQKTLATPYQYGDYQKTISAVWQCSGNHPEHTSNTISTCWLREDHGSFMEMPWQPPRKP